MARIAILFGILLALLGASLYTASVVRSVSYLGEETSHAMLRALTALIPAAFGLVLIVLGLLARNGSDKVRMHTMHAAALLGLIGVAIPAWRVIKALTSGSEIDPLPVGGSAGMAVLCAIFVVLCIKSFIDVRVARRRAAEQAGTTPSGEVR